MKKWLKSAFLALLSVGLLGLIGTIAAVSFIISHYSKDLPDYQQLKSYEPPIITRIYAGDGRLMAEYAQQRRIFMPVEKIPDTVKNAFLAAEDQNFYKHNGVDPEAIARAALNYALYKMGKSNSIIGGSTITQQVVKNFLLTKDRKFERKIKEAILALRIEKALSKNDILELYLNEIFLGQRAYGVAAASMIYFNKSLDELSIDEAAYLAALPKAPNNYHPVRKHDAAMGRRNWVIGRMQIDGHITASQAELARAKPLIAQAKRDNDIVDAQFFAEEVRRELKEQYGGDSLYQGGLTVKTSVDPKLQIAAEEALRNGLVAYDKRHGWRGRVASLKNLGNWKEGLEKIQIPEGMLDEWELAVVLEVNAQKASLGFSGGKEAELNLDGVRWARKCLQDCYALGPEIIRVNDVLDKADIIMVEKVEDNYVLRQVPKLQGAIIALDPHTGRVLAMQGGWTFSASKFNRATQAQRQPGSAFKPFVYLAALDEGFTPSTRVLDAPFVYEQAPGDFWRPTNYSNKVYGPTPIRKGVEKSRNLMTVRLADHMGMDKVVDYAQRFGIADQMKPLLAYSLGAGETTLLKMTTAYGMLVNGGKKINPTFVDRIQDRQGKTIFSHDKRPCVNCGELIRWEGQRTPNIPDAREQIADEKTTYQIVSILEGVVQRGTARRIGTKFDHPLAGKTGTTNESKDAWFIGFSPNLVVGVYVGFDDPKSMGKRETGSSAAAPIFADFMETALQDIAPTPFRVPSGVKHVRVDASTGRAAMPGDSNVIWEAFVSGTEPNNNDYAFNNRIIGAGQNIDPFGLDDPDGYGEFGYEDYADGYYGDDSVEIYDPTVPVDGDANPFSYFSNQRGNLSQERLIPSDASSNQIAPSLGNNEDSFSGTGGIY